jgi:hypothetical protein
LGEQARIPTAQSYRGSIRFHGEAQNIRQQARRGCVAYCANQPRSHAESSDFIGSHFSTAHRKDIIRNHIKRKSIYQKHENS